MKKITKMQKIREAVARGESPKEIAKKLKMSVQRVYTAKWLISKKKAGRPKKVGRPRKTITITASDAPKQRLSVSSMIESSNISFLREELAGVERQLDNLNVIASFLTIRLRQLEQNAE